MSQPAAGSSGTALPDGGFPTPAGHYESQHNETRTNEQAVSGGDDSQAVEGDDAMSNAGSGEALRQQLEAKASEANQECAPDLNPYVARRLAEWSTAAVWPLIEAALAAARVATATEIATLVKGLRKAVANDETEWIDANIIRLLLDRYDTGRTGGSVPAPKGDQ